MNTTPRTAAKYAEIFAEDDCEALEKMMSFAEQLEKELNEANAQIGDLNDAKERLLGELETGFGIIKAQEQRIKRLEDAGDRLTNCIACGCNDGGCRTCGETKDNWLNAKETKP